MRWCRVTPFPCGVTCCGLPATRPWPMTWRRRPSSRRIAASAGGGGGGASPGGFPPAATSPPPPPAGGGRGRRGGRPPGRRRTRPKPREGGRPRPPLRTEERSVLLLHYMEDFPVAKVAAIMHMPVGTVKSHLKRGRDKLETFLKQNGYETA